MRNRRVARVFLYAGVAAAFIIAVIIVGAAEKGAVLTGKAAMGDWTRDAPGVTRKITVQDLPADYISSVRPGGFYGWPWYYIGNHQDPRHQGKHPELADKVIVPMCSWKRTRLRSTYVFIPVINSLPNTRATSSLRSAVHGPG
jgi:hypothetical protein